MIERMLRSQTFAWIWIGVIFAIYGGMARPYMEAGTFWTSFIIAFGVTIFSGYNLGRVRTHDDYGDLIEQLLAANQSLAKKLLETEDDDNVQPPVD